MEMNSMGSFLMWMVLLILYGEQVVAMFNRVPPVITSSFDHVYWTTSAENLIIELQCRATGIPKPEITWIKDGAILENNNNSALDEGILRTGEKGIYYCTAENKFGRSASMSTRVEEASLLSYDKNFETHIYGKQNEAVSIPCYGRFLCTPESSCSVEWKKGYGTGESVTPNQRIAIDSEGTLHFLYAMLGDKTYMDSNGYLKTYGCGRFNELVKTLVKSSAIQLTIEPVDFKDASKVVIPPKRLFSDDVVGKVGSPATLQCIFGGLPIPSVEWSFKKKQINVEESDDLFHLETFPNGENNTRKLMIRELRPEHEGEYECRAIQKLTGSTHYNTISASLFLNVTGPPQFLEPLKAQIVPLHSNAYFRCEAESLPMESRPKGPVWYKNWFPIDFENETSYSTSMEGRLLTVADVNMSMTSNIACRVHNSVGMTTSEAYLLVIENIVILRQPPAVIDMQTGQVLNLNVSAKTDPDLTLSYQWGFKRIAGSYVTQTEFPSFLRVSDNGRNLNVDSSGMTIENIYQIIGEYTVNIFHMYDSKNITVSVTVADFTLDDVIMIDKPPRAITLSVGETTNIYVNALNNDLSTTKYQWAFREMDGTLFPEENLPKYFRLSDDGQNLTIQGNSMTKESIYDVVGSLIIIVYNDFSNKTFTVDIAANVGVNEGTWSDWTDWSPCSRTCGKGTVSRSRSCKEIIHRNKLPANNSGDILCDESNKTVKACAGNPRCEDSGSNWSDWSACEGQGKTGQQSRRKECTEQALDDCTGSVTETRPCPLGACQAKEEKDSTPMILVSLAVVIAVAGIVVLLIGILLIRKSRRAAAMKLNQDGESVPLD